MSNQITNKDFIVGCPHCGEFIIIDEINCAIFRHGILHNNYKQIDPHLSEAECKELILNNQIFGCGKPFRLIYNNKKYEAIICDYI
jgi:hypothetical protein